MARISVEISPDLEKQVERLLREGWYADRQALFGAALSQFLEGRSFMGDSPRALLRFAADALNESKPETSLKFIERGLALLTLQEVPDLNLYQGFIELRLQALLVLDREDEAVDTIEEARQRLPNNPGITAWYERLKVRR
jgi:hypothetical protein